ncbi:MAG: COG4223 family protein, partial [Beijerinckiaceae bacterium]
KMAAAPKSSQRAATADPDAKRAAAPGGAPSKSAAEPSEPAKPVAEAPAEKPAAPPATPAATPQVPAAIAALPPEVAKLEARLKELEGKIKPPADLEPLNTRIAALAGQIEPLAKKIEPLEKQVDGKIAPIAESLAKSAANITANAKAIETAGQQAAVSMARSNAAASAIVARTLADRVAAGKPFGGLIAALEAMGTKGESVDMLKPLAEKGVPAKAALVSQFQSLESRLLEPEAPPASAPLTERLKQGALSLVKVRPVGKPEGTSPGALYARILGALRQDRFEEAKKLYDVLPPKSRQLAEQWAQNLQTRIAAESAAQSVLSDALTQLQQRK